MLRECKDPTKCDEAVQEAKKGTQPCILGPGKSLRYNSSYINRQGTRTGREVESSACGLQDVANKILQSTNAARFNQQK